MSYEALTGRKRRENPVGGIAGAFVIARPVGENWMTSDYFVYECRRGCGYETKNRLKSRSDMSKRKCPNCGGTADG